MKAKPSRILAAGSLALLTSLGSVAWAAGEHHHGDNAGGGQQQLRLNAGKKWATDAALRQSMTGINQAMAAALPAIHQNRFGNADYEALASSISQHVAYAIEHCRLAPEADAMLHLVIGELMAGAEAMAGKTAAPRHEGAVRVMQALKSYGKYFQHPHWKLAKG